MMTICNDADVAFNDSARLRRAEEGLNEKDINKDTSSILAARDNSLCYYERSMDAVRDLKSNFSLESDHIEAVSDELHKADNKIENIIKNNSTQVLYC